MARRSTLPPEVAAALKARRGTARQRQLAYDMQGPYRRRESLSTPLSTGKKRQLHFDFSKPRNSEPEES